MIVQQYYAKLSYLYTVHVHMQKYLESLQIKI